MIIPSIDIADGRTVQLVGGKTLALEAGEPALWLDRFRLAGEVAVVDLDAALGRGDNRALIEPLLRRARVRVGGGIRDQATARRWLDAGAERIVIGTAASPEFLSQLPRDRLIAALDAVDGEVVVDGWRTATGRRALDRMLELRDLVSGFLVTFVEREGRLGGTDLAAAQELVAAAGTARVTIAGGVTTAEEVAILDGFGADAQVGMALYTGRLDLGAAIAAPLVTDRPDGLIPTVVVDELGVALGLAYSSRATLSEAVQTGRGVYHSRTRGRWVKGESSGATQELLAVALDCDRDTIRFTVRQAEPGFCHEQRHTCWDDGPPLSRLGATLEQRRRTPVPGSYTQRLFGDPALLASKLTEEARELAEAEGVEAVTAEAADLLYFTLVKLSGSGVPLAAVGEELGRRALRTARRPGDAKPDRGETMFTGLRRCTPDTLPDRIASAIDAGTMEQTRAIVEEVRQGGERALLAHAARLDGLRPADHWVYTATELAGALAELSLERREVLERTAERIRRFAEAQRGAITDLDVAIDGGRAGHTLVPVERVGCYVPAGRYPLPSSLLMTALAARAAGVREVWVVTPRPDPIILAAAALAGVDGLFTVGGAQAIAALAYGAGPVPACDVIVGPGNRWVTAAKRLVAGDVGIDMLAGPSELVVVADVAANPALVAADLLAQAEHDPDALPVLITTSAILADRVDAALRDQLATLPTAGTARAALADGYVVLVDSLEAALATADRLAPEHLQLSVADPAAAARAVRHAGALFLGEGSAEVYGDYGAGPNHVLPTGGAARHTAGLSVFTFLRARTWLALTDPRVLAGDAAALGRLEGLEGHARAAAARGPGRH
ncbi:MAG TPA: histidinol dehydrogenase [Gemmatimonadales bacterium]|nr:histidinol dehydrogenase [Gemmatimonadales bacterium]